MTQERLNAVMILNVHKDKTDKLSLVDIANEFVTNERRSSQFGKFSLCTYHVSLVHTTCFIIITVYN